jgi:hypothetical protein
MYVEQQQLTDTAGVLCTSDDTEGLNNLFNYISSIIFSCFAITK